MLSAMASQPSFTLGIEEEFQVIDPETRQLRSHIQEMFAEGEKRLGEEIKREMHDPVIEVGILDSRAFAHLRSSGRALMISAMRSTSSI